MAVEPWPAGAQGVVELPSGLRVRGRSLRGAVPAGPAPTYAVHLTGRPTPEPAWPRDWVRWPDFWVPTDPPAAIEALRVAHRRAATDRVEIGCGGGVGRTGTALAALAVLEGLSLAEAVDWIRTRYHRRAVEVPWQRAFLRQVPLSL